MDSFLKPTDKGIEWGSGRSTTWIAKRVAHLTSIEHVKEWFCRVQEMLQQEGQSKKVDYRFVPCEMKGVDEPINHPYTDVVRDIEDESLQFALVDGRIRITCMEAVITKLAPGGLLILDDANRFLPNLSNGQYTTVVEQRTIPRSPRWADISDKLSGWRWLIATDGICDTRFWIK